MSQWTDIGQQLRETREKKDLDLRDISHITRIPHKTLQALEDSDYSIFPSPAYARSFLAQYSEYLEVDAQSWINAFETGDVLSGLNDHNYLQEGHDRIGNSTTHISRSTDSQSPSRPRYDRPSSNNSSILQNLTVLLITAALIAGAIFTYKKIEPTLSGSSPDQTNNFNSTPQTQPQKTQPDLPEPINNTAAAELPKTNLASTKSSTEPSETEEPRDGPPPRALVIEEDDPENNSLSNGQ